MSGHSKWSTIKHKKAALDAKRGKSFSMISKMVTVAVKEGGSGDPSQNPRLRLALEKAREVNMPKQNIQKAVDKGLGKGGDGNVDEVMYEGYGPGGVGLLVRVLTDNRNRTGAEIKNIFEKHGGSLGGPGSVMYLFEREGDNYRVKITIPTDAGVQEKVQRLVETLFEHEDVELVVTSLGK